MAATIATLPVASNAVPLSGTGYVGSKVILIVKYDSTDGRRHYCEMRTADVVAGALSAASVPVLFASGTMVVKTFDTTYVLQATSGSQAV